MAHSYNALRFLAALLFFLAMLILAGAVVGGAYAANWYTSANLLLHPDTTQETIHRWYVTGIVLGGLVGLFGAGLLCARAEMILLMIRLEQHLYAIRQIQEGLSHGKT